MEDFKFELYAPYLPSGDQPQAIERLSAGIEDGFRTQVLLGVTGSGKTFTMANVIERTQRPALVIAHNKTLAAQLCNEFREFFPKNRVEFFVSYYDYYQPEAYIPKTDTYIEKDLAINDEIDKLRHSATASLCERRDTIVVSSVSCIYGLGAPDEYYRHTVSIREGTVLDRDELLDRLVDIQYKRSDIDFARSTFRARGDVVEIFPSSYSEMAVRVEFFGDTVERITEISIVTGTPVNRLKTVTIFPASHYIANDETKEEKLREIHRDMLIREEYFKSEGKLIEAQRIRERVSYDIEMIREIGYCSGIENYSRYFDGRAPGTPPYTLLDFFPNDFITFIDESHMTIPQIRGMYAGDKARKTNLVGYGFRLPAAFDNRPLNFGEFDARVKQTVCVSATPAEYELNLADDVAEQVIRPTGLVDPEVSVRSVKGQIDDLISEINSVAQKNGRILVTTLTKKMAENLTEYLNEHGIRVKYMHSDIDTLERINIVASLRRGEFDALVGINLLREGLDIPEVMLVCILDADKEGFLRSDTSLIQTIGRAARNSEARVIMYADTVTGSMERAIKETERRRRLQTEYNEKHGIIPKTIIKDVKNTIEITSKLWDDTAPRDILKEIEKVKGLMKTAASVLDFETAIKLRDELANLKRLSEKNKK
ncbi:MAG: excinuclease ABC subunit UvrB [Clostridiales bacterium]|jgi:excinuclease ABC subunit B|nr:excinuclease ABC subunit UvrB [Clostridiales bacterium]